MAIKKYHLKFFLSLFMLPWVISCASGLSSQFSCQSAHQYGRCLSLSEIDQKIDSGELTEDGSHLYIKAKSQKITLPNDLSTSHDKGNPQRHRETIRKIWIAPYEDSDGNYHQGSDVYTILQPGYWQNTSSKDKE